MKNNITELVFILDRSGSMSGLEADTVGGFNSLIEKQKTVDGKCFVTTVLFSSTSETIHDRMELGEIRPLSGEDYVPAGCTALLDAIGETIRHISKIHKYARPEDVPEHTTVVIMTDGMENASRTFTSKEVKRMIESEKELHGWEFLFLAANIDAVETASRVGIRSDRAVDYCADSTGTKVAYEAVAETICNARMHRPIDAEWSSKIKADLKKRGKA